MECCVVVSADTVLQIDKFYTVVRRIFELTFRTVVLRRSECDEAKGLQSKTSVRKSFSYSDVKCDLLICRLPPEVSSWLIAEGTLNFKGREIAFYRRKYLKQTFKVKYIDCPIDEGSDRRHVHVSTREANSQVESLETSKVVKHTKT